MSKQKRPRSGGTGKGGAARGGSRPPTPAAARGRTSGGSASGRRSGSVGSDASGGAAKQALRPAAPGFRGKVERLSWPALQRLHTLPRWIVVGASLALLVTGILAPRAVAVPALALVVLFLGWLTYLAWPEGGGQRKGIRIAALTLATVAVVVRAATE